MGLLGFIRVNRVITVVKVIRVSRVITVVKVIRIIARL